MKMPIFDGKICDFPRFKSDVEKQVMPCIDTEHSAAYVLKSCWIGEPLEIIKSVDDDVEEMWCRLKDRYGRAVLDGEDTKYKNMVDVIESRYHDLKRANMEREISNTIVISLIEVKLPRLIRREWYLKTNKRETEVDGNNKYPALMEFLLEQKKCI